MRKSLLFVINTLSKGGAEVALLELLHHIDYRQYEVDLFVLMGQGELIYDLPREVRVLNASYHTSSVLTNAGKRAMVERVVETGCKRGTGMQLLPYMLSNGIAMMKQKHHPYKNLVWRMVSDGAERIEKYYDLAVAFLEGGATYYVADHVNAAKKVAYIHVDYEQAGYTRALDKDCYLDMDAIFMVSQEVKSKFLKIYPECKDRTSLFYNMINQDKILRRAILDDGFTDAYTGLRLLTVGRLDYQKGYDIAIQAMTILKQRGVEVRWYILGDGSLRDKLTEEIQKRGLEEDFCLLGSVENPYPYFEQCDIYVHATRYEGKSIAIQEAMTLGCPVIASNCVGNRELVTDGINGLLCELTPEGIAGAVEKLVEHATLRQALGEKAAGISRDAHLEIDRLLEVME